jgi:hypothetical protein
VDRLEIIENLTGGVPNRMREKYFITNNPELYNQIIEFTKNISDIRFPHRVWHWVNGESDYIRCLCGRRVSQKMNWKNGYKKWCSNKCSSNSRQTAEKRMKTVLEKWGVDHYSKTDEYVEKVKETSMKKWGVSNYSKTQLFLEKAKKTSLEKWGVTSFTKTDEYLEKSKTTSLKNWGFESPMQSKIIKDKIKSINREKIGVSHIFQSHVYRKLNFKIANDPQYLDFIDGYNIFSCMTGHTFKIKTDDYYGRKYLNKDLCTVCNPISSPISMCEKTLLSYICSVYDGPVVKNYRVGRLEIDIYLPDLELGIEFNGVWWHSEKYRDSNYHINKTNYFNQRGIRIIHIWEDDWESKRVVIQSRIKNWLGLSGIKIFARLCSISIVDSKLANQFLNENHIEGWCKSGVEIGLFQRGELVSIMTFKKLKGSTWRILRFCSKLDHVVTGGASKLLTYFINSYKPCEISTAVDIDSSSGYLYRKLGFIEVKKTGPTPRACSNRYRVWDSGKIEFSLSKKNPD